MDPVPCLTLPNNEPRSTGLSFSVPGITPDSPVIIFKLVVPSGRCRKNPICDPFGPLLVFNFSDAPFAAAAACSAISCAVKSSGIASKRPGGRRTTSRISSITLETSASSSLSLSLASLSPLSLFASLSSYARSSRDPKIKMVNSLNLVRIDHTFYVHLIKLRGRLYIEILCYLWMNCH